MQKYIQRGNLGGDPELRRTTGQNSKSVTNFRLATTKKRRNGPDSTVWIDWVAWDRQAEIIAEHAKSGSSLLCSGEFRQREWMDGNTKRTTMECHLQEFEFVGAKPEGNTPF